MHDAGTRRDHAEILEGTLGELEKLVALGIALELERDVQLERFGAAVMVDLH